MLRSQLESLMIFADQATKSMYDWLDMNNIAQKAEFIRLLNLFEKDRWNSTGVRSRPYQTGIFEVQYANGGAVSPYHLSMVGVAGTMFFRVQIITDQVTYSLIVNSKKTLTYSERDSAYMFM